MPSAPSQVERMTESVRMRFMFTPLALAYSGLDPTVVMAVPVRVRMNIHIRPHSSRRNRNIPVGK